MVAFDSTIARDSMQKSSATALGFYAFTDNFDQQYSQLNFRLLLATKPLQKTITTVVGHR